MTQHNQDSQPSRSASLERKTGETSVNVTLDLDGQGRHDVDTGNGFLDHMVSQVARHGLIDITLKAQETSRPAGTTLSKTSAYPLEEYSARPSAMAGASGAWVTP